MGNKRIVCDAPFTKRYSKEDLIALMWAFKDHFEGYDAVGCIDVLVCNSFGSIRNSRKLYDVEYSDYIKSTLNFEILKRTTYDEDTQIRQFTCYEIIIHILEVPVVDLPLYLGSRDEWVVFLAKWRLKFGK